MSSYTYTGFWINHDRGSVLGATTTFTKGNGLLLTAFISAFVVFVGSRFWTIFSFVIYDVRATNENVDAVHRQHQVILRNSGGASNAWWEFVRLPFAWRRKPTSGYPGREFWVSPKRTLWIILVRSWTLSLWALVIFGGWTAASIFSSKASKAAGTETLIRSNNCGTWNIPLSGSQSVSDFSFKLLSDSITAANYARACYGTSTSNPQCNTFVKQQMPWTTKTDAPCPFASGWCWYNDTAALELSTGYIDSHEDLGINAPKEDRVKYRKVTKCSVIPPIPNGKYFIFQTNTSTGAVYQYYYGEVPGDSNYTFQHSAIEATLGHGYDLSATYAQEGMNNLAWTPIAELNTTNLTGDLSLINLAPNSVQSPKPIDDPFFSAHKNLSLDVGNIGFDFYGSDYYEHVMGCVDQHQFCNPNRWNSTETNGCTPLAGYYPVDKTVQVIGYNVRQLATAYRILNTVMYTQVYHSISGRGSSALRANELVFELLQNPLPNDQWVIEVSNWFAVSLSRIQHAMVEFAAGPTSLPPEATVITPTADGWPVMCKSQKVKDAGTHQNFSVLALGLIFGIGGIIIILSWTLEPCVNKRREKRNPRYHKRLQWILDENLQLQRMAYQYVDMGSWEQKDGRVPVTVPMDDERIFRLPEFVDPRSPGLSGRHDVLSSAGTVDGQPLLNGQGQHSPEP